MLRSGSDDARPACRPLRPLVAGAATTEVNVELSELFRSWEEDLVDEALTELRHARLQHYVADGEEITRERVTRFIEKAMECFSTRAAEPMVEHAENIARERFAAGYDLFEVQTAINVIEEALWKRILSSIEPDELAHALGMVNAIFGMSKDVLARTYVSLATDTETPHKGIDEILDG
jgi:hypothetical protein